MTDREMDEFIENIEEELFGEMELIARLPSTGRMNGSEALRLCVDTFRAYRGQKVTVLYPAGTSVH